MSPKTFKICLHNPSKVYYAGQVVTGSVQLSLSSDKTIRGIVIQFKGRVKILIERITLGRTKIVHSSNKKCSNDKQYLVGSSSSRSRVHLSAGDRCYPFRCVLPSDLPSSIEGFSISIRYLITACVELLGIFGPTQNSYESFSVIAPLDLNEIDTVREPRNLQLEKTFFSFGSESGPLRARISLPASGYISGQAIPITVDVENDSNVRVHRIRAILVRNEEIHFLNRYDMLDVEHSSKKVAEIWMDGIPAKSSRKLQKLLEIPPLLPSHFISEIPMVLSYEIKV